MKKTVPIIIVAIIVVAAVVFGIAHMHKSTPKSSSNKTTSAAAVNNSVISTKTDATLGQYLADPNGKPLYTYGADTSGVSNCSGACLASWPAYQDKGATTGLPSGIATITRTDNSQVQYTYNGMPLYYFAGDSGSQPTGDGVSNFHIAAPAAASSQATTPSSDTTPSQTDNSTSSNPY